MPNPGTKLDKERNRFYEKRGYNLEGYSRYKTLKPPFYIKYLQIIIMMIKLLIVFMNKNRKNK